MAAIVPVLNRSTVAAAANTRSGYVRLATGLNKVNVYSTTWSGKAAALKYTPIDDDAAVGEVLDQTNTAVSLTANGGVDMYGPGCVCIDVTSANAAEVVLLVNN
jgi:hypothetical protein